MTFNVGSAKIKGEGKAFQYLLPSVVGPGADPGVQAVIYLEVGCHYFPPGLQLPTQVQSITAAWSGTKLYCLVTEAHRCEQPTPHTSSSHRVNSQFHTQTPKSSQSGGYSKSLTSFPPPLRGWIICQHGSSVWVLPSSANHLLIYSTNHWLRQWFPVSGSRPP